MRVVAVLALLSGCTSLGPMPSTTMIPALPAGRPGLELGLGAAPGYFLSSGVTEEPRGAGLPQLSLLFEPDRLLGLPGLIAAARVAGTEEAGTFLEPMIGYRRAHGSRFAWGVVGYGTRSSKTNREAHYSATRMGVEGMTDVRVTPSWRWLEIHLELGASLTGLIADGEYCVDQDLRYGIDCPEPGDPPGPRMEASASGIYPTGHVGVALLLGNGLAGVFHGARITLHTVVGSMPTVVSGVQEKAEGYAALGLSFAVGLGASSSSPPPVR